MRAPTDTEANICILLIRGMEKRKSNFAKVTKTTLVWLLQASPKYNMSPKKCNFTESISYEIKELA